MKDELPQEVIDEIHRAMWVARLRIIAQDKLKAEYDEAETDCA